MLCSHKSRTMIPFALLSSAILGCLISSQVSAFQNQYCDPVTGVCQPVQTYRPATFQPTYRTYPAPTVQPVTTFSSLDYSALSSAPVKKLNYDVLEFDISFDGGDSEKIKVDEPFEVDGRKFVIKELAKPMAVSAPAPVAASFTMPAAAYTTPVYSSGNCPNCPDCNPQAFQSFGTFQNSTFDSPSTVTLSSRPGFSTNRIMTGSNGAVYRFAPIRTAIRNFFSRF